MRSLSVGVAAWLVLGAAAVGTPDDKPVATIQKSIDSFNKGDAATADLTIIDEVEPHLWQGAQAFQAWSADLESHDKKNGITDQKVTIAAPIREVTSADKAYVVVPAVYSFKQKGVAMRERAQAKP
jgi:hypothetical protein